MNITDNTAKITFLIGNDFDTEDNFSKYVFCLLMLRYPITQPSCVIHIDYLVIIFTKYEQALIYLRHAHITFNTPSERCVIYPTMYLLYCL